MKADVLTIPKMWFFSMVEGFKPELLAVKVEWKLKKKFKGDEVSKKKTRPQFSILRSVTESAWAQYGWFHADSVTELKIENCGRVFFLWRLVISMTDQFFRTHPSLTAYSSRSKPHTPNKLHIFGKLWTWAFAWSYPGFFSLSKFRGMSVLWKS